MRQCWFRVDQGQEHTKPASSAELRVENDTAAVTLDDAEHRCQPQASAREFGRVERVEYFCADVIADPWTVVRYFERSVAVRLPIARKAGRLRVDPGTFDDACAHDDRAHAGANRFGSVRDQVQDNLTELCRIAAHRKFSLAKSGI